jgi:hypothetical protein
MKAKLLLAIFFFGSIANINAQISIPEVKPTNFDDNSDNFLITNKNIQALQNLPYPIIFIHGLNSNSKVWLDLGAQLVNKGLSYGGRIDFSLNDDNNNSTSNKNIYPTAGADIALFTNSATDLTIGDFYFLNFDINNIGQLYTSDDFSPFNDMLSNEASIVKQGVALKYAIQIVLQKTGRDKVVIMGHSMGGLCAREYIQNPSIWTEPNVNHHIAKLVTTGTPHGGFTGINLALLTGINDRSEAYRDLKKTYSISGNDGVYLYGGFENYPTMNNNLLYDFYNVDVNCNGTDADNTYLVGLNNKTWINNLDYSYIVGVCTNCEALQGLLYEGDGIVRSENANLSNFTNQLPAPINQFIYTAAQTGVKGLHSELPQAIPVSFQGLDEPNETNIAYGVNFGNTYKGFVTLQPANGYIYDYDDYKFSVTSNSQISVLINNTLSNPIYARILNSSNIQVGQVFTINTGSNTLSQYLSIGVYYLEIYATPASTSYLYPYSFSLSSILSKTDFASTDSLIIYPNPTSSNVNFDNSVEKFETATIINYLGQILYEVQFDSFNANQEVDLSSFTTGVYIIKFSNKDKSISKRIIKE